MPLIGVRTLTCGCGSRKPSFSIGKCFLNEVANDRKSGALHINLAQLVMVAVKLNGFFLIRPYPARSFRENL